MNHCKRVLITLCMILLLGVAAYAEDSQSLTNEWFGADGSQSNILGIESLPRMIPRSTHCWISFSPCEKPILALNPALRSIPTPHRQQS